MGNEFSKYIEELCTKHPAILHRPEEKHFVNSDTEKDTAISATLHYPAVSLDKGDFHYRGEPGAFRKENQYKLLIIDHVADTGDHRQIRQKIEKCEKIMDDFMHRMIEDKKQRKYQFLNAFNLADTEGSPIENVDNALYGVISFITLEVPFINCESIFLEK